MKGRKCLSVVLALVLLLAMTACGKWKGSFGTSGEDSGTVTAEGAGGNEAAGSEQAEAEGVAGSGKGEMVAGKLYTDDYDSGALFRFGMVPAKCDNGKWGYVNQNGDWAIEPSYERTYPFSGNGLAIVAVRKRAYSIIDRDGNFVSDIELEQHNVNTPFSETGVKSVRVNRAKEEGGDYYAVLEWKDGRMEITAWDDSLGQLGDFTPSGYALVGGTMSDRGQRFGIVDSNLNFTVGFQERYLAVADFYGPDDHLVVYDTEEQCYCVMDVQGNVLYKLPEIKKKPYFGYNTLAQIDNYGVIDETGRLIRPEEDYFTPTKKFTAPDVELSFRESDWMGIAFGRDHNFKYPISMTYWNGQGEKVLSCIRGRAMKNGLAVVCLEVRAGTESDRDILVDENGVAYIIGTKDGYAWVVINENLEIQYSLEEQGIDELETYYYNDGYAISMVEDREADEEYNYIVDGKGNRLFERDKNPELPINSITNSDSQFTGRW